MRMTFGQYKNCLIEDVPPDYLAWVLKECKNAPPWLLDGIREHLMGSRAKAKAPPPPPPPPPRQPPPPPPGAISKAELDAAIKGWYRTLAVAWHPDKRKGSNEGMIAVNQANEELRRRLSL